MANTHIVPAGHEFSSRALREMSTRGQKVIVRDLDRVQGAAVVAAAEKNAQLALALMHEQGRALIANEAMNEVAALTAFEQQIAQTIPSAAPRVAAIANAYTMGAVQSVLRW